MHRLLLLFSQLVFAFFTSVLLSTFMVTWQFMLQQFQSPSHKLLGKFSGTPWRQCNLSTCKRQLLVKCVNLFVATGGERNARGCLNSFVRTWSPSTGVWSSTWKWVCSDTEQPLSRNQTPFWNISTGIESSGLSVGRLKTRACLPHREPKPALLPKYKGSVFVISRALLLFCSGSLSGNQTSFSASKPCWNSVTEMNVYRVFLVSNFMVFSFVLFKAIPLFVV